MSSVLKPYAVSDANSRGRVHPEPPPMHRTAFQRDRDRIIHATAFRRLEYKTQVFVNHEGDLYRTRLTHSIEVAQISRTAARSMGLNEDLVEAIALAHDLGHTPFGHAGQDALNDCMRDYGGFEHNIQSLRVVDKLEERYLSFPGLNLTFESREGILKHCPSGKAAKFGTVGARFLDNTQASLEAQLVDACDALAYNNHDVDDGLRSGLLSLEILQSHDLFYDTFQHLRHQHPQTKDKPIIAETIRHMIDIQVRDLIATSTAQIQACNPVDIHAVRQQARPLIGFSDDIRRSMQQLRKILFAKLYLNPHVQHMAEQGKEIITSLFAYYMHNPRKTYHTETEQARATADYIAGMTDRFASDRYDAVVRKSA
jgi:dGTPase